MNLPAQGIAAVAPVEGTTTPTEPVAPAAPAEKPQEKDQFAEKLELLSRKERAIFRERQRVDEERKAIAVERAEYEKFKALKQGAKRNPLDYLSEAGLSYDELTQFVLNGGKSTEKDELAALRDHFDNYRKEQEDKEKKQSDEKAQAQAQAELEAIEGFKSDITQFIEDNKQTYELSSLRDATEDIFSTINDQYTARLNEWNDKGRIGRPPSPMSIKEAADVVEDFYEKEVIRLTEADKLRTKLGLKREAPQDPAAPQTPKPASKTLTNNMASTAASVIPAKNDNDRMQRALAKLSGQ